MGQSMIQKSTCKQACKNCTWVKFKARVWLSDPIVPTGSRGKFSVAGFALTSFSPEFTPQRLQPGSGQTSDVATADV